MKRIYALILALALACACFAPAAFAQSAGEASMYLPAGARDYLARHYDAWTVLAGQTLDAEATAALAVLGGQGRNIAVFLQCADGQSWTARENDALIPDGAFAAADWIISPGNADSPAYLWHARAEAGENAIYIEFTQADGAWRVDAGTLGADDCSFQVTNKGTALRVCAQSYYEAVYVPLTLDVDIAAFDPAAARAFCLSALTLRGKATLIPSTLAADALPQGKVVAFKAGKKYPVYAGPGKDYLRLGEKENAVVSTNDWIQVFGRDGDWLLIQYNLTGGRNRFGYITASALPKGETVAQLNFTAREGVVNVAWMTDEPLGNCPEILIADNEPCTVLATMGEGWLYAETRTMEGKKYRGFIVPEGVDLRESHAGKAMVRENGAALYQDEALTQPLGRYNGGAEVTVLETLPSAARVRVGGGAALLEGYMALSDIAPGALPGDIKAALPFASLLLPESEMYEQGYAAPAPDARRVPLSRYDGWVVLGEAGEYIHVRPANDWQDSAAFVPRAWVVPQPVEYIDDRDCLALTLSADTTLFLRPEAGAEASPLTLYAGVQTRALPVGAYYLWADYQMTDGRLYGYFPKARAAVATAQALQIGLLTPADQADCCYLYLSLNGSVSDVYGYGTRVLLLGETEAKYFVRTPLGRYGFFDKRDITLTNQTGLQADFDALCYGTAVLNGDVSSWRVPYDCTWSEGGYADGTRVKVLSNLGAWAGVTVNGYDAVFVKTEALSAMPENMPLYTGIYNQFRDKILYMGYPLPLLDFTDSTAFLLLNVDGAPVISFREKQGDQWPETARTGVLLGAGLRVVTGFAADDQQLSISCYVEESNAELRVAFTRAEGEWLATGFAMKETGWSDGYGMETLLDYSFVIDARGLYIPGDQRAPVSISPEARTLQAFSAKETAALCARYLAQ